MLKKLKQLNILIDIFGECHQRKNEYLFFCPFCSHHKRKLSINLQKKYWKCWVCHKKGKSLGWLVGKFGSNVNKSEWLKFDEIIDCSEISLEKQIKAKILNIEEQHEPLKLPKEFKPVILHKDSLAYDFLINEKKISDFDIIRWQIGFCDSGEFAGNVIIPSFDLEGNVNFFVGRSFDGNKFYHNSDASKNIIFNDLFIDWNNDIILVEGPFDAIKHQNAIPLLGNSLNRNSKLFKKLVESEQRIYIALDSDAKKQQKRILNDLCFYGANVFSVSCEPFKDPGEMTKKQFLKAKYQAYRFYNSLETKILYSK